MIKVCTLCNEEFEATQKTQKYCKKPHYKECPVCKEKFLLKKNRETKTCSNVCANKYRMENKKYTLICRLCNKEFISPFKHTKICKREHYQNCVVCGKEYLIKNIHQPSPSCSQSCGSSLTHTEEAKENRRLKSLERYGTEHPFQAKHIVEKIQKSLDNSENDTRIGSKRWNKIMQDKYGVANISQVEEMKKTKEQTYLRKYGVLNPAGMHIKNYEEWADFENFVKKVDWDCLKLAKYFNVRVGSIRNVATESNTEKYIKGFYTYTEPELTIKEILNKLGFKEHEDFNHNDRSIIYPLEIDFYVRNLNVGIEVSPTYTHNSKEGWAREGRGLEKDYHYNKLMKCEKEKVKLLTVFDWTNTQELEKVLINALELKNKTKSDELNKYEYIDNHKWNNNYKESLNIEHDTFKGDNYRRIAIKKNDFIIASFVLLENKNEAIIKTYNISKEESFKDLFKFFIDNYTNSNKNVKCLKITTDSSLTINDNYENIGFEIANEIEPRLHYHNIKKDIYIKSSQTINKYKEILDNNSFLPVYDCGHREWMMIL